MVYNSVPYATNTQLQLQTDGATVYQAVLSSMILSSTSDVFTGVSIIGTSVTTIIENAPLLVNINTGNPTAGDSDITVYLSYRLIEL